MRNMKNVQNKYNNMKENRKMWDNDQRKTNCSRKSSTHTHTQIDDSRRNKENDKFSFNRKVFVFVLCKYYVERLKPNFSSCCCAKHLNGFVVFSSIFWQRDLERERERRQAFVFRDCIFCFLKKPTDYFVLFKLIFTFIKTKEVRSRYKYTKHLYSESKLWWYQTKKRLHLILYT